jgi:excisionase family DNA binding protein
MNFADAIRQAAKNTVIPSQGNEPYLPPDFHEAQEPQKMSETPQFSVAKPTENEFALDAVTAEPIEVPEPPAIAFGSGNIVRLELFLAPEQMNQLFRSLVATQHTMYTLREAAHYLRVSPNTIEAMANDSQLPGILIEGRWRFPKSALDEWISIQAFKKGVENVA